MSTDPFGNPTASTGNTQTFLGYAGEYRDDESGFTYLRARYYDPSTAQFLTRDPIGAITRSDYGYATSSPLNLIDPTGLISWDDLTGTVGDVADVAGEIVRDPGAAVSDAAKGLGNFGVGVTNAALGTSFEGWDGPGQAWSRNIGSGTFWVESALATGLGAGAQTWARALGPRTAARSPVLGMDGTGAARQLRFLVHRDSAHHTFRLFGRKLPHIQCEVYLHKVRGAGYTPPRIPVPRWIGRKW
jgi:RHS repeat-associated protein